MANDTQRTIKNLLQYEIDKVKLRGVIQASESLRNEFRQQVQASKQVGVVNDSTSKKLMDAARSMDALQKGTKIATEQYDKLASSAKSAGDAAGAAGGKSRLSSLDTLTTGTQRALSGVGVSGPIAGAVGGIGDIAQLAEDFPKLKSAVAGLPGAAKDAYAAIGGSGVGLIGGVALLTVALSLAQKQFEATSAAAKADLDARAAALDLVRTGSKEDIKARIDQLTAEKETNKARADEANEFLAKFRKAIADDPTTKFFSGLIEVGAQLGIGAGQLSEAEKAADAANAALGKTSTELDLLQQQQASGVTTAAQLKAAEEELRKKREDAIPRLEALAQQSADLLQKNGEQVHDITEERTIRDLRATQDYNLQKEAQQKALNDNLEKIDSDGQDRLAAIRVQGVKRLEAIDAQIGKLGDQRNGINQKYMESERKAFERFRDDELKETKRFNKERVRLLQDISAELLDAEEANDVIAFIQAKRRGEKELQRQAEDAQDAKDERLQQFQEEREAADQAHQEELARIDEQIAAQQEAKAVAVKEIQDQRDAEIQRIKDTKKATQDAFDEQQVQQDAARNLRLKRQDEDDQRADLKRQNALTKALGDIDAKARKEAEALGIFGQSLNSLINAVQAGATAAIARIVGAANTSAASGYGSTSSSGASSSSSSHSSGSHAYAFGFGGKVTKPTRAILGERPGYGDYVIPYQKSKGVGSALEGVGGKTVNVYMNGNIGDGVPIEVVKQGLREMGVAVIEAWKEMRSPNG